MGRARAQANQLATASITRTIGTRPLGWYSRYAPSLHTRKILLEAGYEYDSETYNDELPYWVKVGTRRQLVVPYSLTHNDVRFARMGMTSGDEYLAYIKNAVQCVLEEDPPRMLSFGLHDRIISHPEARGARPRNRQSSINKKSGSRATSTSRATGRKCPRIRSPKDRNTLILGARGPGGRGWAVFPPFESAAGIPKIEGYHGIAKEAP
jgi:hypothetical protein